MKKLVLAVSLLAVLALAGCSGSKEAKEPSIRFFVSGDVSEGSAYSKMAAKYEKETGVKVEVTDVPYADLGTKVTKAVQANDAPDVARVSGVEEVWADALMDLTDVAKERKTIESMTVVDDKGIVKALPTDVTAVGMYINKALFDEAGVSFPTKAADIWTWDEFLTGLDQVLAKTDAKYGLVMDASDHRLRAFTYQFGGEDFFLNDAGDSYETDEATKKSLEKFVEMNDNKLMPKSVWTSGEDASSMFKSGLVAAYMSGSWQIADFEENIANFEWQSVYMPAQPVRATNMGGNFLVGFKDSQNSEEAAKFIDWLYTAENYQQLCTYAGYLPAVEGVEVDYQAGAESYKLYNEEIEASAEISGKQTTDQVTMGMKGYAGLTGAYRDSMVKVLNDEISLDEMIAETIKDYNAAYLKQ